MADGYLTITRQVGEQIHLIDEQGRRIHIAVERLGHQSARISVKAPPSVAIVRPEMGAVMEADLVQRARSRASTTGDAA